MAHTYASVDEFKRSMVEGGTDYGTTSDADLLLRLEGASRRVDGWCGRSQFGSGFGPRLGTNVYDGNGETRLYLGDDLITYTSGTVAGQTGGTGVAIVETTDFYLEPSRSPKRWLRLHLLTSVSVGAGYRIWSIVGKWGYQDERVTSSTTLGAAITTTTATTFTTSATPTIQIGQTLLIDSEQMYLTGLSGTTATVVRGANGTATATHLNAAAIDVYQYPRDVKDAALAIAIRRWRSREAGLTGEIGGGGLPVTGFRDSELSLLKTLAPLKIYGVG